MFVYYLLNEIELLQSSFFSKMYFSIREKKKTTNSTYDTFYSPVKEADSR